MADTRQWGECNTLSAHVWCNQCGNINYCSESCKAND